jgi:hypothetical protein
MISKLIAWARSRQGLHDLSAAAVALVALYESLKQAGVL